MNESFRRLIHNSIKTELFSFLEWVDGYKYMVHTSNKGFLPLSNDLVNTNSKLHASWHKSLCWLLLMQRLVMIKELI